MRGSAKSSISELLELAANKLIATDANKALTSGVEGLSPTFTGLTLTGIAAEGTDVDRFLVSNAGLIKSRTGAQVLSDIGASVFGHNHGSSYNPVPVCTSYGTEAILSSGSNDEITGANQVCDWVWLANQDNYKYLLIAGSGPADINDFWLPPGEIVGPLAITNTNQLHFFVPGSGGKLKILWGAE